MQLRAADAVEMKAEQPRRRRKPSVRRPQLDGRRHVVRRARALARLWQSKLGAVADDAEVHRAIIRAAELTAIAEGLRERMLRADATVSPDDVVRAERLAQSAVRALRLPARTEPKVPAVDAFLRARAAEQSRPT